VKCVAVLRHTPRALNWEALQQCGGSQAITIEWTWPSRNLYYWFPVSAFFPLCVRIFRKEAKQNMFRKKGTIFVSTYTIAYLLCRCLCHLINIFCRML